MIIYNPDKAIKDKKTGEVSMIGSDIVGELIKGTSIELLMGDKIEVKDSVGEELLKKYGFLKEVKK